MLALSCLLAGCGRARGGDAPPLPAQLSATGLFVAGEPGRVAPELIAFSPQYPLWSDGARKQRWMQLPPGTAIDASDPEAWVFPPGTRLWKEFSHGGRPVETRYIERLADGRWRYATYLWNSEGSEAVLADPDGAVLDVPGAPGGRYEVPSRDDCVACHEGAASPVLGAGSLQLSGDRDPLAPHAEPPGPGDVDLRALVQRGLLTGLPAELLHQPPRIAARSPIERAVLGYLHGNCGHCHNRASGLASGVPVDLSLQQHVTGEAAADPAAPLLLAGARSAAVAGARVVAPGDPGQSLLLQRMATRNPYAQMPPIGTRLADDQALSLVRHWITTLEPVEELP